MIFDDFDNAMEANEIVNSDRDECEDFLDANGQDVSEFDDDVIQFVDRDGEWEIDDGMDGDHASALASAGWGTDEDYGDFGADEYVFDSDLDSYGEY